MAKQEAGFIRRADLENPSVLTGTANNADSRFAGLWQGCRNRVTTALEYWQACSRSNEAYAQAGKYLDDGHTPYVAVKSNHELGLWPWQEIQDVGVKLEPDGAVVLVLQSGQYFVPADTLVFYR